MYIFNLMLIIIWYHNINKNVSRLVLKKNNTQKQHVELTLDADDAQVGLFYAEPAALVFHRIVQQLLFVLAQMQQRGNRSHQLSRFNLENKINHH